jgi:flagellar protein FliS
MNMGEISQTLYQLYDYMLRRLVEANIKKDINIMSEVLQMAVELRNTWEQAMLKLRGQEQAAGNEVV